MADSYNELFGLGSQHAEDANLEAALFLQDDAASTLVDDFSSNGNDGTLGGGDNTADISVAGPNSYLSKALDFDGIADYVDLGAPISGFSEFTVCAWVANASIGADDYVVAQRGSETLGWWSLIGRSSIGGYRFEVRSQSPNNVYNSPAFSVADAGFHFLLGDFSSSANEVGMYADGSAIGTPTSTSGQPAPTTNAAIATLRGSAPSIFRSVTVAGVSLFNRRLTLAEKGQIYSGPELVYSSGASLGADGAFSVGSWILPSPFSSGSNGSITYLVVAVNAAGDTVDTSSSSSGTLDLSSEYGNTVYLLVRASNSGGYDIGDFSTRTSGYGSSGDGYYEVASVLVALSPSNTVAPVVSGTEEVGNSLSCSTGSWNTRGGGAITYTYQWTRSDDNSGTNEANISGETSSSYTLAVADVGSYIRCVVTATNSIGSTAANSNFTGEITATILSPMWVGGGSYVPGFMSGDID